MKGLNLPKITLDLSYKYMSLKMTSLLISLQGEGINFANIKKSPVHPLIDGKSAKRTDAGDKDARYAIFI